jgi:PKD repeat protein
MGNNIWNISKTLGTNIIGGPYLGGNYWSDYQGDDNDKDGLGDVSYHVSSTIIDYLPLVSFNIPPIANFTYSPIQPTIDETIVFNDLSLDPYGTIINRTWVIDGTNHYENNPTYVFDTPGIYTVLLTVRDDLGATDTTAKTILVDTPLIHLCNINPGWNFISTSNNQTQTYNDLIIKYQDFYYNYDQAITTINPTKQSLLDTTIFSWSRLGQYYTSETTIEPGYGYWIYAYRSFEILTPSFSASSDDYITSIEPGWNIISVPFDEPINTTNILVNGVFWQESVTTGQIDNAIYGWNTLTQTYNTTDTFQPGEAYWLYAYQSCLLQRI